ncbi:Thiamine-phosphate synthase [Polystyrenella longa]|uniref:Thiamine-phosphate synthase n=1 Tax=Polystyrenella longa TaxID=2528007 RepID=A0A518CGY8_9PLAN|nr:thiamine phosphate synthase [Polystyrenella longa]QDU78496.1 Thiamine-phosphate synthase [Polystyrenella longa]
MPNFPFTEQFLTAGALRTLHLAQHLVCQLKVEILTTEQLLAALILDESRATEILSQYQITIESLPAPYQPYATEEAAADLSAKVSSESPETIEPVEQSESLTSALLVAQQRAAFLGRHAEIGTEHLLWGLLHHPGSVKEILDRHGLKPETLEPELDTQSGFETEPLEVDVQLHVADTTPSARTSTFRILDAAANRAREGMRVIEDYVRFTLDDTFLSREFKELRHRFTAACSQFDQHELLASRNTTGDVGTTISTPSELQRESGEAVLAANFKRLQESLRTLEEWSKVVARESAPQFEQIRYQVYQQEKVLMNLLHARDVLQGTSLYLLLTESLCHHGSGPAVRDALEAGLKIVQIREKEMPTQELIEHAKRVREWTHAAGALLIINDRPDIALAVDADGVHLGQDDFPVEEARKMLGARKLIGLSTHNIDQARQAVRSGADYIGVGPTFSTTTKQFTEFAGLDYIKEVAAEITLPWFPIGGINAQNLNQVLEAGATRAAISGAICGAEKPHEVTQKLLEMFAKNSSPS